MRLYHGAHTSETLPIHIGLCLTDSYSSAEAYAGDAERVYEVEISLDGLTVEDASDYDRDENDAPGDRIEELEEMAERGIDVITYQDEDEHGRSHDCWRIISDAALDRIR